MNNPWTHVKPYLVYSLILLLLFVGALRITEVPVPVVPEEIESPIEEAVVIPDFAAILDVELKKQTFFDFIEPYVHEVNREILQQRERLLDIRAKIRTGAALDNRELRVLSTLAEQYEVEADDLTGLDTITLLLRRVDIVPVSLALAQAANESAWGTSRFAQDGNNFFGQWCYSDGCGLVPNRRRANATHEVRSFDSVADSVRAYILNLNTFPSYQMLRRIRQSLRQQDRKVDGVSLADGLESYSERGLDYIEELQSIIYANNLLELDGTIQR